MVLLRRGPHKNFLSPQSISLIYFTIETTIAKQVFYRMSDKNLILKISFRIQITTNRQTL